MNCIRTPLHLFAALACLAAAAPVRAQALDTTRIVSGLTQPLYVTAPPGDTQRLFIVQRGGAIRIFQNGALNGTAFMTVTGLSTGDTEQGLLGLAFHPDYANNGLFYVAYTRSGDGAIMIVQYSVTGNPDIADSTSNVTIKGPISHPQTNHNGSCLQFGFDGMLYTGMGDGGNFNDTGAGHAAGGNAQSPGTLLGKMLRLDVDNPPNYIPANNPYVNDPTVPDEIWAFGMRNPWRFSFDRLTGDLYIGDVGQGAREEVDFEPVGFAGGRNYGWRCMEGFNCTGLSGCTCNDPALTLPIHDYTHAVGCSITGGYVYRGSAICGFDGTYFYADYCSARIWTFEYVGGVVTNFTERTNDMAPGGGQVIHDISSFGQDGNGELYICDFLDGEIYKIVPAANFADCNQNAVSDVCDISNGTSSDVNTDGVPDECQCPVAAAVYCTAKVNSLLCVPAIDSTGAPNASSTLPFLITGTDFINNKSGLLFYGYSAAALPFQGGTLCVKAPVKRTAVQSSGGNPPPNDCSGTYSYDFKQRILSGADPLLVPGAAVFTQYWARDPGFAPPDNTSLSDGLTFTICN